MSVQAVRYSGPLPPPEILADYDKIEPGFAGRIILLTERQSAHRQELEAAVVRGRIAGERRGQILGFILALIAIAGSIGLLALGREVTGLTGLLGTLATLAGVFVYGRISQKKELAEKREDAARAGPPEGV